MTQSDLRDFVDNAQDGMHWVGADGTILWANPAELRLLGYDATEYVGRHISEFHDDQATIEDILRRLWRREAIQNYPARMRHKDGSTRDVLITSSVLWRDGEFVHTRCITRDVTEQRRLEADRERAIHHLEAEHALIRLLTTQRGFGEVAADLLRTIAEAGSWDYGALWMEDEITRTLRLVETWHSDGFAPAEFIDDSRARVFPPSVGLPGWVWGSREPMWIDDVVTSANFPRAPLAARAGLHAGVGFPIRVRSRVVGVIEFLSRQVRARDDGMLALFDAAGTQIGHFIERRELDEVRDRLAAIVDSSDDAIISKTLDGVITSWNRGAESMFGYTADEAIGEHITLVIPDDRAPEEDEVLARLRRGEKVDHYETIRRRKDGRVLDISLTVSPLRNADGRIVGASKVARDITVRKHAEEQLRLSEQRAVAAVQARDDFLSTAAHELRNPLNALQLQLVGLHRTAQQSDEWLSRLWVTDRIGQAVEDTAALVRLVHNLLDVARIAAGRLDVEPEDIDFADVIRAVVRRFGQQLVGERVMIEAPAVRGRSDRLRFEQIVTNLVSNAIKFGGGKPIEITLRADDERAYLAVSDHGIGIDPERQSQLFERFSRAVQRREYGGFGLGLWIARETVSAMGGEIWFSSSPGEGTTFSVSLPRVLAKEATAYAVK